MNGVIVIVKRESVKLVKTNHIDTITVRLSVRLSVCHTPVFSRNILSNIKLYYFLVATPFQFFCTKRYGNSPTGTVDSVTVASNVGVVWYDIQT